MPLDLQRIAAMGGGIGGHWLVQAHKRGPGCPSTTGASCFLSRIALQLRLFFQGKAHKVT
jgi:hypothetical protein